MLQNTSGGCFCISCRTASVCCRRKVAAVKIEKLKAFIIRYCDISKTYSIQFHLSCSVNLSYFYFFIHGFQNSRTIAPEENCPPPPNPKLTLNLTPTLTGGQFSSGAIVWLPPTLKLILTLAQTPTLTRGDFPWRAIVQIPIFSHQFSIN